MNSLFSLENAIITPHAAYYSDDAIRMVREFAAHEVVRVLTGTPPLSPVNAAARTVAHAGHHCGRGARDRPQAGARKARG